GLDSTGCMPARAGRKAAGAGGGSAHEVDASPRRVDMLHLRTCASWKVRHLDGQWIPRKNLEEAQVRMGNRVW
ncbi:MAG TPA: hypothetical protein VEU33_29805, partial [Archangium sp.]|nr:hypothetical protein [Archangium sp.]